VKRDAAARFTFLMSVPAVTAAAAKAALDLRETGFGADEAGLFLAGMAASALIGYLTVKYFVRYLGTHGLDVFAWYRIVLAAATFVWLALGT
jgi:undecaprenyl-diphosphatase